MSPGAHPEFHFDNEELKLDVKGLTGGYTLRHVGELKLLDYAEVQFPHDWNELKIAAATHIIETTWQLHGSVVVEGTLAAGLEYTRADGVSGQASAQTALVAHILDRPTVQVDFRATFRLEGTVNHDGFSGSPHAGLDLTVHF